MNTPTEEKLLHTIALTMTDTQGDEYMHALTDAIAAGVTIDQIRDYTQHALQGGKIDPDTATQVQETLADDRDCIIPQAWADTVKAAHDTHHCLIRDTLDATTYEDQPSHVTIYPHKTGSTEEPTDTETAAHDRALREQIARDIEAKADDPDPTLEPHFFMAIDIAASIARGEDQTDE